MRRAPVPASLVASVALAAVIVCLACAWLSTPVEAQRANFRAPITCDAAVAVNMNTITTTQVVALTSGQRVYVCGFALVGSGLTSAKFVRGTGANCGTGTTDVTGPFEFGYNTTVVYGAGTGTIFRLPLGEALCVTNSADIQLSGVITYAKF